MINRVVRSFVRFIFGSAAVGLLAVGAAHAQALYQPLGGPNSQSITLAAGNTPQGVATADFNHDGLMDMVVANKTGGITKTGSISVYLASAPGKFGTPTTYPTCGGPTAVLAADLELTGLPDIVVTCNTPTSNVIEVFLNLGNGTFSGSPTISPTTNIVLGTGAGPVAITKGDFNSDGHPDLAVADQGDGTVTLFLSNATTHFQTYTTKTLSGLGSPTAITAGRYDTSGHMDLAVTDATGNVVNILIGDGTGNFTVGTPQKVGQTPDGIVSADLNNDGLPDLATINAGDGTITVLFGTGNDQFQPGNLYAVYPASGTGGKSILAVDVNGDGALDLVTGDLLENTVAVLANNGNGTFQPVEYYNVPNGPIYLASADFRRTGKQDLAVTQQSGATVSLLVNNTLPTPQPGGLNFGAPSTLAAGYGNMADGIAVADVNGDGKPDLVASYLGDNAVRVVIGAGGGAFQSTSATYSVGKHPYWVATGDLNLDGYADIVTANEGDNTISVLMNNGDGSGTFAAQKTYPVGRYPTQVAIGDLNGDGIPDLAVTNIGDNTVSILFGQTGGTFVAGPVLATGTNPYGVAIGDFRRNGQNDLAVTCFGKAQLDIFLNNGDGTFQSPQILATDIYPTSVAIGDFNRDGNLDVMTGNSIANDVSFFAGNGNGTFQPAKNSYALNFPDSFAVGDVNGDGILDAVTVAPNFQEVSILLGKGDGTFQQRVEFASGQQPWATALADFNSDGKLDIVTANTFNRVNITTPAKQQQYLTQFPPTAHGNPSLNVLLNTSGTNISFSHSPNGAVDYNVAVTLSATITPAIAGPTPTGTVLFEDTNGMIFPGGPSTLNSGTASLTVPDLGSGSHQITALYSGSATYQPHTQTAGNYIINVKGTPVALSFSPTVVPANTRTTYTIVVGTPGNVNGHNPTGTVSLYALLPSGPLLVAGPNTLVSNGNGTASSTGSLLNNVTPGTYYLYAVYTPSGNQKYKPGSSSEVMVVAQ